jgi:multidrug efflux pump subunit AcrB
MMDWIHAHYDRLAALVARAPQDRARGRRASSSSRASGSSPFIGSEFFPRTDDSWTNVRIQTPVGSSLAYTASKADQVEAVLRTFPEIERVSRNVSKTGAWFGLRLVDKSKRKRSQAEIDDAIRKRLGAIAGLDINIGWNRPLRLHIMGPDVNELNRIAIESMERMKKVRGVVEVESSYKPTTPSLDIHVNRELASDLGVSMYQIAATTRALIGGEPAGQWEGPDGENHQVLLRLPRDQRTGIADLDRIYVASYSFNADATPRMVPLRQIAQFRPSVIERQIDRRNLQRQVQVSAGITKDVKAGEVSVELKDVLKDLAAAARLPHRVRRRNAGHAESIGYALAALGSPSSSSISSSPRSSAATCSRSRSWRRSRFRSSGSSSRSFFSARRSISSRDRAHHADGPRHEERDPARGLHQPGHPRRKDPRAGDPGCGQVRLRPILMTSAAMVFGMLPLALSLGAGSEQQSPMAHAVIGGIITSTALTLIVVPVLYTYVDTWGRKARGASRRRSRARGGGVEAVVSDARRD